MCGRLGGTDHICPTNVFSLRNYIPQSSFMGCENKYRGTTQKGKPSEDVARKGSKCWSQKKKKKPRATEEVVQFTSCGSLSRLADRRLDTGGKSHRGIKNFAVCLVLSSRVFFLFQVHNITVFCAFFPQNYIHQIRGTVTDRLSENKKNKMGQK